MHLGCGRAIPAIIRGSVPQCNRGARVFASRSDGRVVSLRGSSSSECPYSGMFPCFLGGLRSTLVDSIDSAAISFARVWRGSITSSM